MIVLLIRFEALPSARIAVLFAFRSTDIASEKNPTASRVPTVGNEKALIALDGLYASTSPLPPGF